MAKYYSFLSTIGFFILIGSFQTSFAQEVNRDMKYFQFTTDGYPSKRPDYMKWSGKKMPTGEASFTDYLQQRWVGNFIKGRLQGSFTVFDKDSMLILQGTAYMDTVTEAIQYKVEVNWSKKIDSSYYNKGRLVSVPVFSGTWKNGKWYAGRWFTNITNDQNNPPRRQNYIDAAFGEDGYPVGIVEEYTEIYLQPGKYYLHFVGSYKDGSHDGFCQYFYDKGIISKPGVKRNKGNYKGNWRKYTFPDDKTDILYTEAHWQNFIYNTSNEPTNGWVHFQYKDGHCEKVLYGQDGKPIAGSKFVLPVIYKGIRPDSSNFQAMMWKGLLYSGSVEDGKPNGWGKWGDERQFREGFFMDGKLVGVSDRIEYTVYEDRIDYFAVYLDGNPSTDIAAFIPRAEEIKKAQEKYANSPKQDPVNLLTKGDVIKIKGVRYVVMDNPRDEKQVLTNFRGWVTLSDNSILNAGTPFEKLNEKVTVFDYETCTICSGTGREVSYTQTKLLVTAATYRTYERVRGNRVEEVTVQAQPAVYDVKTIAHSKTCWVCKGEGKLKK